MGLYDTDKISGNIIADVGMADETYEGISKDIIHAHGKLILRDDNGIFGYDDQSKDWYLIYKYWNLNSRDIKKLVINGLDTALNYGGMSEEYYNICKNIIKKYNQEL